MAESKVEDTKLEDAKSTAQKRSPKIVPVHIPSPAKVYSQNIGRSRAPSLRWETGEWDLAECGRILDSVSGGRYTAVKLNGELKILSFEELWQNLQDIYPVEVDSDREYIHPDGLEVLSGELLPSPDPSIEYNKNRGERKCCVPDCDKKHRAKGYCSSHYDVVRKNNGKLSPVVKGVWKECKFLTRHKVNKKGYSFLQKNGCTEVTEDHSLITIKDNELVTFTASEKEDIAAINNMESLDLPEFEGAVDLSEFITHPDITSNNDLVVYTKKVQLNNNGYKDHRLEIPRYIGSDKLDDFIAILGAYISEGSVKEQNGFFVDFRISQQSKDWLEDLKSKFENVFPSVPCKIIPTDSKTYALSCNRHLIACLFAGLGGYRSENKRIPEFVFLLDDKQKDIFKRYMLDGDGSRYNWGYTYTSKSLKLISGWSFLLKLQGINHSFSYKIKDDTVYYNVGTTKYYKKRLKPKTKLIPFQYKDEYVYDLEVEDTHNFIDLAGQVLLHNTESYVRRAFRNKKNLWLKEGYEFVGGTPERIKYIEKRIHQIEEATAMPFPLLVSHIVWSLVRCNNAFIVKVRDESRSGGVSRKVGKKLLHPVAGYFPMAPETVRFKRDEMGTIKKYKQCIRGKEDKKFKPEDVIHFYLDKREGFAIGTPTLVAVKDDIRALRRIEENVELLVYQHLFPLFHYKVGTEDAPADTLSDGSSEIDVVKAKMQAMPTDGCWVTPERHEIKVLGAEGNALAVDKVIEHFKQRIFTGLGNSSVDMGEGGTANRSTADTMSRNLIDDTKADQREFGAQFYNAIIRELLLESTFDQKDLFDEENKVFLKFNEIDLESRIKKENHYADIFVKNTITHDEMRQKLGLKPFVGEAWPTSNSKPRMFTKGDGDYALTNYGLFERDKIILQSIDEPGTDTAKTVAKSTASKNNSTAKSSSTNKAVSNKNKPKNQHGTRSAPKTNRDAYNINDIPSLSIVFAQQLPLGLAFNSLKQDIAKMSRDRGMKIKESKLIIDAGFTNAKDRLVSLAKRAYRIGLEDAGSDITYVKLGIADGIIQKHVEKYVYKLRDNLMDTLKRHTVRSFNIRHEDAIAIEAVFNSLAHRSNMIDNSEIMRAYNYGLASGYRVNGFDEIESVRHNDTPCAICDSRTLNYKESDVIIYEELPPLHPNCTCVMKRKATHL